MAQEQWKYLETLHSCIVVFRIMVSLWVLFIFFWCSTIFFCTGGNAVLSLAEEEAMNIGMQWLKNTRQYQETFLYPVVNLGKMDFETT